MNFLAQNLYTKTFDFLYWEKENQQGHNLNLG